tara:strand:- start:2289 stop:3251 length:963 start_codon:yes stop_codon:yes gene_type:complete
MKILVVQNRMGIGDTIIFLPFIKAISQKFNSPVNLLIKQSSKADQYLFQTKYIDQIIFLERNKKNKNRHDGFLGSINLIQDLRQYKFDKIFIFNSSIRFQIIARFSRIPEIYQYPLFDKYKQHITDTAKKFIKENLKTEVNDDPEIQLDKDLILNSSKKFKIDKEETNILLGIGGSGPSKRIPAKTFLKFMDKISSEKKCKFFLATGKSEDEQIILNEIKNSKFNNICVPLDDFSIRDILPIIKNCNISICNDTSFGHLSAALGVKTITLMADAPLIYGSYNSKMFPIIPDGEHTVTHKTSGKDKINPIKIYEKFLEIIN